MPFPFTFKLAVPGLNSFSSPVEESAPQVQPTFGFTPQSPAHSRARPARPNNINQRRPSPSPSLAAPLSRSRKRAWDPSVAEPSQSTATLASQTEFELEEMNFIYLPPAKRRRGLAGSIVSTAVSAALIGTAVGLTVYRLWRDRGKDSESDPKPDQMQMPPPPYQKGEWNPVPPLPSQDIQITPPTPLITPRRRKVRHGASAASATKRHGQRPRPRIPGRGYSPPSSSMSPAKPSFFPSDSMEDDDDTGAVENQMDWIGDQLSMLIQEGQKALGREIVIKSDAREDEIDDGCGVWEEEEGGYDQEFGGPSSY
ncbi:hypothetical protein C8R46DRAFT_1109875 [Mycena filopes]|nr:hypothetical protein C8R46DRAFT_1109875 [Mycena filopes]